MLAILIRLVLRFASASISFFYKRFFELDLIDCVVLFVKLKKGGPCQVNAVTFVEKFLVNPDLFFEAGASLFDDDLGLFSIHDRVFLKVLIVLLKLQFWIGHFSREFYYEIVVIFGPLYYSQL